MIGAIAGDVIGSVYEKRPIKTKDFELFHKRSKFTDDTVLTIAVADCIMNQKPYEATLKQYGRKHLKRGYGSRMMKWLLGIQKAPFNSFGNGSAMRVSPVGFLFETPQEILAEAKRSAEVTHNHPEGVKGAQAIAWAIFMARKGKSKSELKETIASKFGYDLDRNLNDIRKGYSFDVTCQGSVPEAIISFLASKDYEDAIRNAISLGGDSDTLACMAGGIAEAYYQHIPSYIIHEVQQRLKPDLLNILSQFQNLSTT